MKKPKRAGRITAFLLTMALVFGAWAQKAPALNKKPVYVIVHGAWGGSWAYRSPNLSH